MQRKRMNINPGTLIAGVAVGAGIVLARNAWARRHPYDLPAQRRIERALDRTLQEARRNGRIVLDANHRYIIFSDHHKGARNRADNFQQCEETYLAALDHYFEQGHTLIVLGDAEELLEESIASVLSAYENVLRSEARFHPERHIRLHGNHDDAWQSVTLVRRYLDPIFPNLEFKDGLVFEFSDEDGQRGEIFLAHGHQGTLDSDVFAFMGRLVLPYYRDFQILTGWGRTSPAQDDCLRAEHDTQMYRWASRQPRLMLIAGHTHRPVWSSVTHLEKLVWQLSSLQQLKPGERPADYAEQVARLKREIQIRQEKYPPCSDTIKTRPCYFNTGCSRFDDGDITGIEIENGLIRLIKWGKVAGRLQRGVLEETPLVEIFDLL